MTSLTRKKVDDGGEKKEETRAVFINKSVKS